jgi:ribosomal protein L7/L12
MHETKEATDAMLEHCRKLIAQDDGTEKVLTYLRENGLWKIPAIKAIKELMGVGTGEAKEIVDLSKTWADTWEADNRLHNLFLDALEEEAKKYQ